MSGESSWSHFSVSSARSCRVAILLGSRAEKSWIGFQTMVCPSIAWKALEEEDLLLPFFAIPDGEIVRFLFERDFGDFEKVENRYVFADCVPLLCSQDPRDCF